MDGSNCEEADLSSVQDLVPSTISFEDDDPKPVVNLELNSSVNPASVFKNADFENILSDISNELVNAVAESLDIQERANNNKDTEISSDLEKSCNKQSEDISSCAQDENASDISHNFDISDEFDVAVNPETDGEVYDDVNFADSSLDMTDSERSSNFLNEEAEVVSENISDGNKSCILNQEASVENKISMSKTESDVNSSNSSDWLMSNRTESNRNISADLEMSGELSDISDSAGELAEQEESETYNSSEHINKSLFNMEDSEEMDHVALPMALSDSAIDMPGDDDDDDSERNEPESSNNNNSVSFESPAKRDEENSELPIPPSAIKKEPSDDDYECQDGQSNNFDPMHIKEEPTDFEETTELSVNNEETNICEEKQSRKRSFKVDTSPDRNQNQISSSRQNQTAPSTSREDQTVTSSRKVIPSNTVQDSLIISSSRRGEIIGSDQDLAEPSVDASIEQNLPSCPDATGSSSIVQQPASSFDSSQAEFESPQQSSFQSSSDNQEESNSMATSKSKVPKKKKTPKKTSPVTTPKTKKKSYCTKAVVAPFKLGWSRELVHRANDGKDGKRQLDVYYFSPEGTKLRSMPEIANYLHKKKDPGLSVENFTFYKELVYRPPFETERSAKQKTAGSTPTPKKFMPSPGKKSASSSSIGKNTVGSSEKKDATPVTSKKNKSLSTEKKVTTSKKYISHAKESAKDPSSMHEDSLPVADGKNLVGKLRARKISSSSGECVTNETSEGIKSRPSRKITKKVPFDNSVDEKVPSNVRETRRNSSTSVSDNCVTNAGNVTLSTKAKRPLVKKQPEKQQIPTSSSTENISANLPPVKLTVKTRHVQKKANVKHTVSNKKKL